MIDLIFKSIYFILPAYIANMAPILGKYFNLPLSQPINNKLFGKNKTYRGFISGIISAIICIFLQKALYNIHFFSNISLINYDHINIILIGFLFGFGALFGDLTKSFFKRLIKIPAGSPWLLFDQLDFIIGSLFFTYYFLYPPKGIILTIIIISPALHLLVNIIANKLKIKDVWW